MQTQMHAARVEDWVQEGTSRPTRPLLSAVHSSGQVKAGRRVNGPGTAKESHLRCSPDLYSLSPLEAQLFTLVEARAILDDPVRDLRYLATELGPHITDFLRWKRMSGASEATLDSIERSLARLAIDIPPGVGLADVDVEHLMLSFDRPMSSRGFHEWWQRLIGHAGVAYRKPHMTRHTFATGVLDATDGDIYAVKELLGHNSISTTQVYLHSSRRRKESGVEALVRARRNRGDDD